MSDLESEESMEQRQNQKRQGLKTPVKILIRLQISLAQLKAKRIQKSLKMK